MGRKRVALVGAGCVAALVIAGIVVVADVNGDRGAKDAVRAYIDLIARGDAAGATAMVDPGSVDRSLLTNEVLGSAVQRIEVTELSADDDDAGVGETVAVTVRYRLGDGMGSVALRAKREANSSVLLEQWRVIDPFLVPVVVGSTIPTLDTAFVGAAKVPVSGDRSKGQPQRPVTMYPGVYPLTGVPSKHVKVNEGTVRVDSSLHNRPGTTVEAQVHYQVTPELRALVESKMADYLAACAAASTPHCPSNLRTAHEYGRDVRVLRAPRLDRLEVYQLVYRPDGTAKPAIHFFTGVGDYSSVSTESGETLTRDFRYAGAVDIAVDDTVTVTFDGNY